MLIDHLPRRPANPPPARLLYWVCQFLGWGLFGGVVLASYLLGVGNRWEWRYLANIAFFTLILSAAVSHGLRRVMWRRGWVDLLAAKRLPRVIGAVSVCALGLTTTTDLSIWLLGGGWLPPAVFVSMYGNYWMAFGGWSAIYFGVRGSQRHQEVLATAREAQLRTLKSQVNPHFLFNCLNSVRALIVEDPPRAVSMVTALSELLRYSLTSDRHDTVTLAEELAIVDAYIALERMRFDERLRTERAIDPAALTIRVPPMLVQTLVENGVKHGIAQSVSGGLIRLQAAIVGEHVEISVVNSGGFAPPAGPRGEGLRNAAERLRLLYGARASLTVTGDGDRTVALLSLPLQFAS